MALSGRLTRRMVVVALALLANPAMAETVIVPGVGVRTAVPSGNNPRAPRVYAPGPNNGPPIESHFRPARPFFVPRQAPSPMLQRRVAP
jgi:hypothetical protein